MQEPSAEGIVSLERRVRWTSKNTRDTGRNGFFFLFFQNDNFSGSLRMQDGREGTVSSFKAAVSVDF
ncbi:unnamed protein product [Rhizophagus irregularis]|nr:unnamed protein product [Rhizophagus irregularis]CAB5188914.1 unnamed protein product [Rhizophagus irregularis]